VSVVVALAVSVAVELGVGVAVAVTLAVWEGVTVTDGVAVLVGVLEGVSGLVAVALLVAVSDAVMVALADAVGVADAVAVGVSDDVAVAVAVLVGVASALQPPTSSKPASVTFPADVARALPVRFTGSIIVPAPSVTPACATMFPTNVDPLIVAADVTCQKTSHAVAPLVRTTFDRTLAVRELPTWKM